jgi:hypothetical protein
MAETAEGAADDGIFKRCRQHFEEWFFTKERDSPNEKDEDDKSGIDQEYFQINKYFFSSHR